MKQPEARTCISNGFELPVLLLVPGGFFWHTKRKIVIHGYVLHHFCEASLITVCSDEQCLVHVPLSESNLHF